MAQVRAIVDADCDPTMNLNDLKVQHRHSRTLSQDPSGAVVAATYGARTVKGATGTIRGFRAAIFGTIATGSDRTVTVDLQKSTGGGAFASVLSATLNFANTSTLYTVATASIGTTGVQAGDILEVLVTVAGSAGNQAKGLIVDLDLAETPT